MIRLRKGLIHVDFAEEQSKQLSARYALWCIWRDTGTVIGAIRRQVREFVDTCCVGHRHATCWWTRQDGAENFKRRGE